MKKQTSSFLSLYRKTAVLFPLIGAGVALSYFLAMRNDYDDSIGHFARGSVPALTAAILTVLAVVLAAALAFASCKAVSIVRVPENTPFSWAASIIGCLAVTGMLVLFLVQVFNPPTGLGKLAFIAELTSMFLTPALLMTMFPAYAVSDTRAFLLLMSAGALLLSLFACYFNYDIPLNSAVRNFTTLMQSSLLLLLLAEARLALDPNAPKSYVTAPFQIFACATGASVGFGIALGGLLYAVFGSGIAKVRNPNLPDLRLLLYFALGQLAITRLFALPKIVGDYREKPESAKEKKKS